jgi:hypothetical protein
MKYGNHFPMQCKLTRETTEDLGKKNICIPDTGIKFTILAATQQQGITIRKTEGRGTR